MRYDVNISKNILKWVLSTLDPTKTDLTTIETLQAWLDESKKPTYNLVQQISSRTGIPFGYFFLKTPPVEDDTFVEYRTIQSLELNKPSRELKTIMMDMELIQEWSRNQLISDGESSNEYVNSLAGMQDALKMATIIRNELAIDIDWFLHCENVEKSFNLLRSSISDSGVIVMTNGVVRNNNNKILSIDEFRAFALVDDYAPLIFINSNDTKNAKLFSLLHEYVHIGLGLNSLYNDPCSSCTNDRNIEKICNSVAAEILVPNKIFETHWTTLVDTMEIPSVIDKLSKYFRCGQIVFARKALDYNFISTEIYSSIYRRAINNYKKIKSHGGDFYRTLKYRIDSNFLNRLSNSVEQGKTLYNDAYRLTNTNRFTYKNLLSRIEGGLL